MGLFQKVGNFLGVKKLADATASTARVFSGEVNKDIQNQANADDAMQKITYAMKNETDPEKKQRLRNLAQSLLNQSQPSATQIDPGLNLNAKQIYGSAANTALNVLLPGAFKGGKAAVVAKNAALGGTFGAASGLEKNRNASGVVGSTVGGALVGAGVGVAGLFAKVAKDFIGKQVPESLMNIAVKPALQDLKKNIRFGSDTLGKELLEEGVKGGPRKLLEIADTRAKEFENQLQTVLTNPGLEEVRITRQQIVPYLTELNRLNKNVPGMSGEVQRIKNVVDDIPESMTLLEANQMKRDIYEKLRDVSYKLDAKLTTKSDALKQIAKGLKTEIEDAVGGTVVKDLNKKLSIYGKLENAMVDQLAREMKNNRVGLTDAILLAGGGPTGILALLRHVPQGVETYAAQGLSKVNKGLNSNAAKELNKHLIKRAGVNLP